MTPHCCDAMRAQVEYRCRQHADPADCPDCLVTYVARFDEYGLTIHDGGGSSLAISFCPWCGTRLPESKRDAWFDEVASLGLQPDSDELPARYQTDAWYRAR